MKPTITVTSRPDLSRHRKAMVEGTREAARVAGRIAKKEIKRQIPPPRGAGAFPGYAATGSLQDAVVAQEPVQRARAGDWEVRVGIQRTRKARVYAAIHEFGGVIRARNGGWLVFPLPPERSTSRKIPGNQAFTFRGSNGQMMLATRAVRIRRKRYFFTGWTNAMAIIQNDLGSTLAREIRIRK